MRALAVVVLVVAGCGSDVVTPQSAALACITAGACGIPLFGGVGAATSCSLYVPEVNAPEEAVALRFTPSQVSCIAAAGSSCAAARRCLAGGQTPAACATIGESCDGKTWQSCTGAAGSGGALGLRTFDCAAYGQICVVAGGSADCGVRACSADAGACVAADGTPGGNFFEACYGAGTLKRRDCGRFAASCVSASDTIAAHCRGTGAACATPASGDDTLRCDGNVLVHCWDGQEAREDCGRYQLGCFPKFSGGGFGCFAGNDCDPYTTEARCAGNALVFCSAGKLRTFDCAAAGFASCDPTNGGGCL